MQLPDTVLSGIAAAAVGVMVSYGATAVRVQYAERTAERAASRAEEVPVLRERIDTLQRDVGEIKGDVKQVLRAVKEKEKKDE